MDTDMLTERLHQLGAMAPVPPPAPADDVRRGRRRLRRNRGLGVVGAAAAVTALASAGFIAAGPGAEVENGSAAPVAGQPERRVDAAPGGRSVEGSRASQLESLWSDGSRVSGERFTLAELEAMSTVVQRRLSGPVRWIGVGRAASWHAARAADCPSGWTCEDVVVKGASRARWATSDTVRQLVADLPGGVTVLTVSADEARPDDVAYSTD